jgi:hypothetical protein
MPTPSLLIVPARFKTGKLYSQIPTSGAGDFTVTRNTAARRFDSAGLVASVASGIPRLDYFTSGGVTGCPALLVEPAGTNICLQSEDFSTTWVAGQQGTGVNAAITTNAAIAPDGNTTADLIVFNRGAGNTSNDRSTLTQQPTVVSGTVYTQSVYLKAATSGDVGKQIGIRNVAQGAALVITLTANWVRYSKTETAPSNSGFWQFINIGGSTADNTVSVHAWGAQLDTGSGATSYIPTTAGTGSRSADAISVTGAVSGSIGQTAGTAYLEIVAVSGTNSGRVLSLTESGAPTNNRIAFTIDASNHRLEVIVRSSGSITNGSIGSSAATLLVNGVNKIAYAYDGVAGSNALAINGSVVATNSQTLAFTQALSRVNVAILESDLTVATNQRIRAVALYTTRLTNAELATLTTP